MHIDKTNIKPYLTTKHPLPGDTIDPIIFMHHGWRWIHDTQRDYTPELHALAETSRGPFALEEWFKQDYWDVEYLRPWIVQYKKPIPATLFFWLINTDPTSDLYAMVVNVLNDHKKWHIFFDAYYQNSFNEYDRQKRFPLPMSVLEQHPFLYVLASVLDRNIAPIYSEKSVFPLSFYAQNIQQFYWLHHHPEYLFDMLLVMEKTYDIHELFPVAQCLLDGLSLYNKTYSMRMIHHLNRYYFHLDMDTLSVQTYPKIDKHHRDNSVMMARMMWDHIAWHESNPIPEGTFYVGY